MASASAPSLAWLVNSRFRVSLARAVYARTKYMLLDDPLSAVVSVQNAFVPAQLILGASG